MRLEKLQIVRKAWGKELWLVNNNEYCGKLLYLNEGATCSYHYHRNKKETFYVLDGGVLFTVEGVHIEVLKIYAPQKPITIEPGESHKFEGISDAIILEVSTHHEDDDCVRLSESRGA